MSSSSTKYVVSERAAIVNDTFHGKDVQLDGYSVMLNIRNLKESDFNVSYKLQMSYRVSQTVLYTVLLESASKYLNTTKYKQQQTNQTNKQTSKETKTTKTTKKKKKRRAKCKNNIAHGYKKLESYY